MSLGKYFYGRPLKVLSKARKITSLGLIFTVELEKRRNFSNGNL